MSRYCKLITANFIFDIQFYECMKDLLDLLIEKKKNTPKIEFSVGKSTLELEGRSNTENPYDFYAPVFKLMEEIIAVKPEEFNLIININYMNTSSSKCIFRLIKKASEAKEVGIKVRAVWYYEEEDDESADMAEEFSDLTDLGMEIKELVQ